MTAADLVARLREHGHEFKLDGYQIVVRPRPDAATLVELRARRDEIVAYLRHVPLASEHRYVLWRGALEPSKSVCIACGKPPMLHGVGALEGARVVDDPNEVALIEACATVAAAAAREGT